MCYAVGMKTKTFRFRLETADGILVANRETNPETYFMGRYHQLIDQKFVKSCLEYDCRTKGVRLISYTYDKDTGIVAIVAWL